MKKLFKFLSLLRLLRDVRGHRSHYGPGYGHHNHLHGDHWHPRSRDYPPFYGRRYKPRLSHLVRDLLHGRRY